MTVFTLKKDDLKDILRDLNAVGEEQCCTKKAVIEDLQSILLAMEKTVQKEVYTVPRGNFVYLTGRNPESI